MPVRVSGGRYLRYLLQGAATSTTHHSRAPAPHHTNTRMCAKHLTTQHLESSHHTTAPPHTWHVGSSLCTLALCPAKATACQNTVSSLLLLILAMMSRGCLQWRTRKPVQLKTRRTPDHRGHHCGTVDGANTGGGGAP